MTDEKWQQMWDAAQTVQRHLYVDEIVPRSLTVNEQRVEVDVEWGRLGAAAFRLFDLAGSLPIREYTGAEYVIRSVTGLADDGVTVKITATRKRMWSQPAGTVADLLAGEQR